MMADKQPEKSKLYEIVMPGPPPEPPFTIKYCPVCGNIDVYKSYPHLGEGSPRPIYCEKDGSLMGQIQFSVVNGKLSQKIIREKKIIQEKKEAI